MTNTHVADVRTAQTQTTHNALAVQAALLATLVAATLTAIATLA